MTIDASRPASVDYRVSLTVDGAQVAEWRVYPDILGGVPYLGEVIGREILEHLPPPPPPTIEQMAEGLRFYSMSATEQHAAMHEGLRRFWEAQPEERIVRIEAEADLTNPE